MFMESAQLNEKFDTGMKKISYEIKSRLVLEGLFGTITSDRGASGEILDGAKIEIHAKGKTVGTRFDRMQIEGCFLRVAGTVLSSVIAMVEELSAAIRSDSAGTGA